VQIGWNLYVATSNCTNARVTKAPCEKSVLEYNVLSRPRAKPSGFRSNCANIVRREYYKSEADVTALSAEFLNDCLATVRLLMKIPQTESPTPQLFHLRCAATRWLLSRDLA